MRRRRKIDYWGFYYELSIEAWNCVTFRSGTRLYNAETFDDLTMQCGEFDDNEQEKETKDQEA